MTEIPPYVLTLKAPLGRTNGTEEYVTIIWDPFKTPIICDSRENNCRTTGAKSAPLQSEALYQPEPAQVAPVPPTTVAGPSHRPVLVGIKTSALRRKTGAQKEGKTTLQDDIKLAQESITELASMLAGLDDELSPVRSEERRIKDAVLATHSKTHDGVIIFELTGARERAGFFRQLDELTFKWGRKKEERRRLASQIKDLEKQIQRLENLISKERKKA